MKKELWKGAIMMENSILKRHAVRKFQSIPVASQAVDQLVAAFEAAPCGMHQTEDMEGVVITDSALRQAVEEASNNACYGAPLLFAIATKTDSNFGERDASAAAENIMVQAAALDLGSVYVMSGALAVNSHPDLLKKLGVDDGYQLTVIVAVGQAADDVAAPDRTNRYKLIRH